VDKERGRFPSTKEETFVGDFLSIFVPEETKNTFGRGRRAAKKGTVSGWIRSDDLAGRRRASTLSKRKKG